VREPRLLKTRPFLSSLFTEVRGREICLRKITIPFLFSKRGRKSADTEPHVLGRHVATIRTPLQCVSGRHPL
jgi:hypothetical protein